MAVNNDEIKELVREQYGAHAQRVIEMSSVTEHGDSGHTDSCGCGSSESACCGPEDMENALRLYNMGQLAGLPAESHRRLCWMRESHGLGWATAGRAGAGSGFRWWYRLLPSGAAGGRDRERDRVGHDVVHAGPGPQEPGFAGLDQRPVRARAKWRRCSCPAIRTT